ncbi:predicted protein [Sclerotinia sclerotiorum 1980 UF-70]|uniref:Uncharacterized protein n=1 Tax=Sclerotinia sclerotiorum (strain ATCC 18683 / 1980 / Ss-1) TaxID=665079 RepID=A7EJ87_SCLS1|nr:predicted protein [Sclerotinia sclerotiorum 1980 UF-70]EDO02903.1 predicted protein [Sclerotinia sclerotiorum 1980 UF-70]
MAWNNREALCIAVVISRPVKPILNHTCDGGLCCHPEAGEDMPRPATI